MGAEQVAGGEIPIIYDEAQNNDNCDHHHVAGDHVVHLFSGERSAVLTMVMGKKSA